MGKDIVVLAPVELAEGKTEADLLAASKRFEEEFAKHQPGILRRELVRKSDNSYIDIVHFRSQQDLESVMEKEQTSAVCLDYFSVMKAGDDEDISICESLEVY